MLAAGLVEKLADAGQLLDDRLIFGYFAIEYAQGISDGASLAIGIHSVFDWIERFAEGFVIARAIGGAARPGEVKVPPLFFAAIQRRPHKLRKFPLSSPRF